ncbi:MAG: NnrU family protein [Leptothrix ochracea]|uniref:NnrU family protein n=1 Tax=Leptothrix ochracea TaxID=735331 RepID=UPI0034E29A74
MKTLILGLVLFLGPHAVRIVADEWRSQQIARWGEKPWKAVFSLLSLLGLVLIGWGYGAVRLETTDLWVPPVWTRHLAALLTLPAFVLLAAAHVPGSRMKAQIGHPMLLGTLLWAVAHLLANARVADLLLFGSFALWSALAFRAARRRDSRDGVIREGRAGRNAISALSGLVAWVAFAFWLHPLLIGVRPFGGA